MEEEWKGTREQMTTERGGGVVEWDGKENEKKLGAVS
jgi:hypothetical protein